MDRIERAVGNQLKAVLEGHGFGFQPAWNAFVRRTAYGVDSFLIVNQGTAMGRFFEMKCYPALRHDRIEDPWNTFGFVWGDEAQLQTMTLAFTHPRGPLPIMKVTPATQAADVQAVAGEMLRVFLELAMPFYQRFSSLAAVEEFVNRLPLADLHPYSAGGPLDHQAARSLLLAKAVNPGRYQLVREACIASTRKTLWPRERYHETIERIDSLVV